MAPALYIYHRGKGSSQPLSTKSETNVRREFALAFEAQTMLTFRELEATHGRNAMTNVLLRLFFSENQH